MRLPILSAFVLSACAIAMQGASAHAASISRTYSYYPIDGRTLEEIQEQFSIRGPHVSTTGRRHPGATRMEFTTRVGYAQRAGDCRVAKATVTVEAKIILPKWRRRNGAGGDIGLMWDTLAADIRRHEESHTVIARTHARELEMALMAILPQKTCAPALAQVKAVTEKILKQHDEAQARFDRVEMINFEHRILRLMEYRLERMEKAGNGK